MLDTIDFNQTWEQSKLETINFKIELFGTGWDNVYPQCIVCANDIEHWRGDVVENTLVDIDIDVEQLTEASDTLKTMIESDEWFDQEYISTHSHQYTIRIKTYSYCENRVFQISINFTSDRFCLI